MARSWYLMSTPNDYISGYEKDLVEDFAQEAFAEVLEDSGIATDVKLYSNDMETVTEIKAILQRVVQDTKLNSLTRHLLVPIGTCKAGMYIEYKDRFWLITSLVDDNKLYEKAVLAFCNYKLTWMNSEHKVIQRWANITSASQYNNGETESDYYILKTDQLLIALSNDRECIMLNSGQRFVIDKRTNIYEESIAEDATVDTSHELITYKVTRRDSIIYNYEDSGLYQTLVSQDEQHESDGYYKIGDEGYWLCMYPYPMFDSETYLEDESDRVGTAEIVCDESAIYVGIGVTDFEAVFYDSEGNTVDGVEPNWTFGGVDTDRITVELNDNVISISTDDKSLVGTSFELLLSAENYEAVSITVKIVALI